VADRVPGELRDRPGIAVPRQAYWAYRELLDSPRWLRLANEGPPARRLLWASVKDPEAPDVLYVETLAAPFTVNTMPDHTLVALADHGRAGALPVSMEHTLVTEPDAAKLAVKAAGFMADRIRSAIAANGTFTCALSGGQTPWLMLAELAEHDLPWSSVEIYQVDERVTPEGDPERNLTHLRQILGSLPVTLIPMPVTDPDLEAAPPPTPAGCPPASTWCTSGWAPTGIPPRWCPGSQSWR
jgi:hypothetical protein